jgi:nucleoside-diphosphate-sugar epimerase
MAQSKSKENLLILGAIGYIGSYITEQIVKAKGRFSRIAIFTSPTTAESKPQELDKLRAEGVEVIVGDVRNSKDLLDAFQGVKTHPSGKAIELISMQALTRSSAQWVETSSQNKSIGTNRLDQTRRPSSHREAFLPLRVRD